MGRCETPGVSTSLTRSQIPSCWELGIPHYPLDLTGTGSPGAVTGPSILVHGRAELGAHSGLCFPRSGNICIPVTVPVTLGSNPSPCGRDSSEGVAVGAGGAKVGAARGNFGHQWSYKMDLSLQGKQEHPGSCSSCSLAAPRAQPGDTTQGCPHVEPCPGSAWIPPTSAFHSEPTPAWPPSAPCPDLPLGDSLDGPCSHKGHLDATGLGREPALELQEAPGSSQRDGTCPVAVTAPVTPYPRWNGADAPKQEQVSLSWEIWSDSAAWNLSSGYSRLWIHTLLKSACKGCAQQMSQLS